MGLEQSTAQDLTAKEIELIKNSWNVFMQNPEANGSVLFKNFLYKHNYFSYFSKFNGIPHDKLPQEKVFRNHALAIVKAMDRVIMSLGNQTKMKEGLDAIVERHRNRNVTERQFNDLKAVILETLAEAFKLPEESMAAWTKALNMAFSSVIQSLK